ncbi:MAG: helix-turn-helix domain-containing protein [Pseudonocardia sp.]
MKELREDHGFTQLRLSERITYSRTALAGAETGRDFPSLAFWKACDAALAADGELVRSYKDIKSQEKSLRLDAASPAAGQRLPTRHAQWSDAHERHDPHDPQGHEPVVAGALDGDEMDRLDYYASSCPRRIDSAGVDSLAAVLSATRRLEDSVGSAAVLPSVRQHVGLMERFVIGARSAVRLRVCEVAASYAQFYGWLLANTGQVHPARVWFDRATVWALEAGDVNMVATALSFKGHMAWQAGQIGPMIGLSQAAQRDTRAFVGLRAFSAHQEARGHAMAADTDHADRKVAEAAELAERAADQHDGLPQWAYWYDSAFFKLQRGLTYRYIGRADSARNDKAEAELVVGLAGLPPDTRHSEWATIFTCHLADVYAQAGDPEQACAVAIQVTEVARATASTRLTSHLNRLHARLQKQWPDLPAVTELAETLRTLA